MDPVAHSRPAVARLRSTAGFVEVAQEAGRHPTVAEEPATRNRPFVVVEALDCTGPEVALAVHRKG